MQKVSLLHFTSQRYERIIATRGRTGKRAFCGTQLATTDHNIDQRRKAMTERSYEQAVQVLRNRLGGRWSGVETEGRDEMVDILKHELGYGDREANDTIDAMVESGTLRYNRGEGAGAAPVPPVPVGTGGMSTG